jgi:hypothetical protein
LFLKTAEPGNNSYPTLFQANGNEAGFAGLIRVRSRARGGRFALPSVSKTAATSP